MPSALVLDAGVLVKLCVPQTGSAAAQALLDEALCRGDELLAPSFLLAEVLSVLRWNLQRRILRLAEAQLAFDSLFSLPFGFVDGRNVYERARQLAAELDLPVLYDAVHLAVADLRGASLRTGDAALLRVAAQLPFVQPL